MSRPLSDALTAAGRISRALTTKFSKLSAAVSMPPRSRTSIAALVKMPMTAAVPSLNSALASMVSAGASSRAGIPDRIAAGVARPLAVKRPELPVMAMSASGLPPSCAARRPVHFDQLPSPDSRASSGAGRPSSVTSAPPAGAATMASTSNLFASGSTSRWRRRVSPAPRAVSPNASAVRSTSARPARMSALPPTPNTRRVPVTGASSTSRSMRKRAMAKLKSGKNVGLVDGSSFGRRSSRNSGVVSRRAVKVFVARSSGRQSRSTRGISAKTPFGSDNLRP